MAFNLPRPWSAGYALPAHVRAEDLQRGAFATSWMPRGWYDDPRVGDGGYAVPSYVRDEGYGQGAAITAPMPRGSTVLPVPHWTQNPAARMVGQKGVARGTQYEISLNVPRPAAAAGSAGASYIGAAPAPGRADVFHAYGSRVATHVVAQVKRLPKEQRKPALKRLFDKIDPKLWTRVHATAQKATRAGIPPQRALHHAIATEFRSGMLRELNQVGATGAVKRTSQVGLGCYGCVALGDTAPTGTRVHGSGGTTVPGMPTPGTVAPQGPRPDLGAVIAIGPFKFRTGAQSDSVSYASPAQVPPAVIQWIQGQVDSTVKCCFESKIGTDATWAKQFDDNPSHYWLGYGTAYEIDHGLYSTDIAKPPHSLVKVTNPADGKTWGVYLYMRGAPRDKSGPPPMFMVRFMPWIPGEGQSTADSIFGWVMDHTVGWVANQIGTAVGGKDASNFINDTAKKISDAACQALTTPGAAGAAAAASGGTAAVGVAIAGKLCGGGSSGGSATTPGGAAPPPPARQLDMTKVALVGGAGLLALYYLTKD